MQTLHLANPALRGTTVRKLQQMLVEAGYRIRVDGEFGQLTATAVMDAKRRLGYRKKKWAIRPTAGDRFFAALEHAKKPLIKQSKKKATMREKIVAYCKWGIAHEPQIHYQQSRPFPVNQPYKLPMSTDCSGFASIAYKVAGAPDPNGRGYDGLGYTGTLLSHGKRVAKEHARAGDLVIFGPDTGHHVCVLLEDGRHGNPLLASHGQEAGPMAIRLGSEDLYQPEPETYINYLGD